jgi:hypothetical protein
LYTTPILFLIFNRPETTRIVFDQIRQRQPRFLYIGADGPRENHPDDLALCAATRNILTAIDWECEVKTLFRDINMGCGLAPATAITWFFEQVEEGIILEDDCVPEDSFFDYCEILLKKHRDDQGIMMICGTSYQPQPLNSDAYYFSKYPHVWGWATWKRAWQLYHFSLATESQQALKSTIRKTFTHRRERFFWEKNMQMIIQGLDAWDYQLMYWMWKNNALCITPWLNMISNIGFGPHATHTLDSQSSQSHMIRHKLRDIRHPESIMSNKSADRYERHAILIGTDLMYYRNKAQSLIRRLLNLFR